MMKCTHCFHASGLLFYLASVQVEARSIHECIVVPQATVVTDMPAGLDEFEQRLWVANTGQRVRKGTDTLLLLRLFSESPGVIDSQQYTKITGSLKGDTPSPEGTPEVVDARLTSGGAGFAHKGDYWLSDSAEVELHQPHKGDSRIEVKVTAVGWNSYRKEDRSFYLQFTCQLKEVPVEKLNAWQGGNDNLWGSFGPAR
ncbi:hypothetical protein [Stenotrophomonas riyadhensis]|nr:hypothetical protein [Stenotrophomonas sp. CFS3442]